MKILRVEHMSVLRDGRPAGPYGDEAFFEIEHDVGPCYRDECIHEYLAQISWITGNRRPQPHTDGIFDFSEDDVFGFQSVDQMKEWFRGDLRKLRGFGFILAIYETPHVYAKHGYRQSVFGYSVSKRVSECSLLSSRATVESLMN